MKIYIDTDEWYPIFSPLPAPENPKKHKHYNLIEVSDDLIPRWKKLTNEFNAFQDELMALKNTPAPKPVLVPLDIDDIRATDEFKFIGGCVIQTMTEWDAAVLRLRYGGQITYPYLAANYLRRQHGSTEWKPCTKESK